MIKNKKGQALITVIILLSVMLVLGTVLSGQAMWGLARTTPLIQQAERESTLGLVPDVVLLSANDLVAGILQDALSQAQVLGEDRWQANVFDQVFSTQMTHLANDLKLQLQEDWEQTTGEEYEFQVTAAHSVDHSWTLNVFAGHPEISSEVQIELVVQKPYIEVTDEESGTGTALVGENPLVQRETITW